MEGTRLVLRKVPVVDFVAQINKRTEREDLCAPSVPVKWLPEGIVEQHWLGLAQIHSPCAAAASIRPRTASPLLPAAITNPMARSLPSCRHSGGRSTE